MILKYIENYKNVSYGLFSMDCTIFCLDVLDYMYETNYLETFKEETRALMQIRTVQNLKKRIGSPLTKESLTSGVISVLNNDFYEISEYNIKRGDAVIMYDVLNYSYLTFGIYVGTNIAHFTRNRLKYETLDKAKIILSTNLTLKKEW